MKATRITHISINWPWANYEAFIAWRASHRPDPWVVARVTHMIVECASKDGYHGGKCEATTVRAKKGSTWEAGTGKYEAHAREMGEFKF